MARYTLCGVVYSDALASNGVAVNILTDDSLDFQRAVASASHFQAYDLIRTVNINGKLWQAPLTKMPKTI